LPFDAAGNRSLTFDPEHNAADRALSELVSTDGIELRRDAEPFRPATVGNGVGCLSSAEMEELDIRANFPSRPTSSPTM